MQEDHQEEAPPKGYDGVIVPVGACRKQRRRKQKPQDRTTADKSWQGEVATGTKTETKYFEQRYNLFSLYDKGIQLDDESWYSVTPELVAHHQAARCSKVSSVIVDACCGVGGNTIAFSSYCHRVIAIDVDPLKIAMARHNAEIYGCKNITFILGDFIWLSESGALDNENVTGVFVSPPWGGPAYTKHSQFLLEDMPVDGHLFFNAARRLSRNVALFLPRNFDCESLRFVCDDPVVEVESNFLYGRCKALTAYFGDWAGCGEPLQGYE